MHDNKMMMMMMMWIMWCNATFGKFLFQGKDDQISIIIIKVFNEFSNYACNIQTDLITNSA